MKTLEVREFKGRDGHDRVLKCEARAPSWGRREGLLA